MRFADRAAYGRIIRASIFGVAFGGWLVYVACARSFAGDRLLVMLVSAIVAPFVLLFADLVARRFRRALAHRQALRAAPLVLLLVAAGLAPAGEAVADDARRRAVVELVLLAGMPKALEARLDAFAAGIAKDLPADTPSDALTTVVGKIRDEVRANVVLAEVAADVAKRFKPEELQAAADALRAGRPAEDVVGIMDAKLSRAVDVELARASRRVLQDVDAEVAASTKATDEAIEQWTKDIAELRQRADALATPPGPAPAPAAPAPAVPAQAQP